ncbi:uncharacterized protein BDR25DRAFT_347784 [Lindgomyces ingoldianus]|uniref:Uncharacterized protein n=1 Tax=Lindgomyces ingoldianus TaxID=673940 RepID=A0ACB6RFZ1_9PLEO|nr:uncharacterized protein BDR25DRAFT_347784 [Lindgomyces ingoldianus]KAF2477417.1 hypothetical protein BDR25DRAFT_347784 [Lindgomyces ingoldianus]
MIGTSSRQPEPSGIPHCGTCANANVKEPKSKLSTSGIPFSLAPIVAVTMAVLQLQCQTLISLFVTSPFRLNSTYHHHVDSPSLFP